MSKLNIFFTTILIIIAGLSTDALAGRKSGAVTGAIVGAATGYLTEQKIKEIEARNFFEEEGMTLTPNNIVIKYPDDTLALTLIDVDKVIPKAIQQLNASVARQTPKWENLSGTFSFEESDYMGHVDFVKGKHAFIFTELNGDTIYMADFVSVPPGAWAHIKSFVLNNLILVGVILFGILGSLLPWLKNKIISKKNETIANG